MTNQDSIKWLENLKQDIGQLRHEDLWHYEQAIDEIIELLEEQEAKPMYVCADCLCRVCARNECTDNYNPGCDQDCLGCNGCAGTIDLPEDCPREEFIPDEEGR